MNGRSGRIQATFGSRSLSAIRGYARHVGKTDTNGKPIISFRWRKVAVGAGSMDTVRSARNAINLRLMR